MYIWAKRNLWFVAAILSLITLITLVPLSGAGQSALAQGAAAPAVEVWLEQGCRRTYFLGDPVRVNYRAAVDGTIQLWNYTQAGKELLFTKKVFANQTYAWDASIIPPAGGEEQIVAILEGQSAFSVCRYTVYAEGDSPALPFPAPTVMPLPYLPEAYGPKVFVNPTRGAGCGGTYWLNDVIRLRYGATIDSSVRVRYVRPDGIHVALQELRPVAANGARETFPVTLDQYGEWIFFAEMPGKGLSEQCVINVTYIPSPVQPTYAPPPSPTPRPANIPCYELGYPKPVAVTPNMQYSLHIEPTTFTWTWSRALKADEYFQPQIIRNDVPYWDKYRGMMMPTKATEATVDLSRLFDNTFYDITPGFYCWRVVVVSTDTSNGYTTQYDTITFDAPLDGSREADVCVVSEPTCVDP